MNQQLSPLLRNLLQDKGTSMEHKMLAFLMFSTLDTLPDNPNAPDFTNLGVQIKKLVDDEKITIGKMNSHGLLQIHQL